MRHSFSQRKLGRRSAHRLAMFRNQIASLVRNERIVTTLPKAKELRPIAEKVITHGKRGTVHARRLAGRWLLDRELIKKLFDEIAPRMQERPGGYLRIVKLGQRPGDAAEVAVLELVDYQLPAKVAKVKAKDQDKEKGAEKSASGSGSEEGAQEKKGAKAKGKPAKEAKEKKEKPARAAKADAKGKSGAKKGSTPRKAGSS